jgi:hypothetical protein
LRVFWLYLIIFLLVGCSVYESSGRKFLESQALQYAGYQAQANLVSCKHETATTTWLMFESNERAQVYVFDGDSFQMRVEPLEDRTFSCFFKFSSAEELYKKSADAVDLTLTELEWTHSPPKGL